MLGLKKLLLSPLVLMACLQSWSCSCTGPDRFVRSIGELILKVEVLDVIALDTSRYAYTATRVKVIDALKGEFEGDTLFLLNDKGFECFHTLPNKERGQQYIITGDLLSDWNSAFIRIDHSYYGKMMLLDLCLENYVFVEGQKVRGHITKNRVNKVTWRHRLYDLVLSEQAYGNWKAKNKDHRMKKGRLQSMSLAALERKLKKRGFI